MWKITSLVLLLSSCSSLKINQGNVDEFKSITRLEFIKLFGEVIFEKRIVIGNNQDYYALGLCQKAFSDSNHSLNQVITRAEVAACLAPFISFEKKAVKLDSYKDIGPNHIFKKEVGLFYSNNVFKEDSKHIFGVNRPIKGSELHKILNLIN